MSEVKGSNRGWVVTFAGVGINLALGVLYSWSVIKKGIPADWNWTDMDKNWPYTIACLVFAFMMVPAGRLQDRFGPRIVASAGGVLTGLGLILASFGSGGLILYILGFGILAGTGIGFGYASATPPAVKWFPPAKTGMIAGIVVSGFGLASVYISPLSKTMIAKWGVPNTLLILGIAFMIVVTILAQFLVNPPPKPAAAPGSAAAASAQKDWGAGEMMKTPAFYLMWIMFAFNAGAGLMIIGNLATLVKAQTPNHSDAGFLMVAFLAVGNAGGRLLAGTLSDKLGRMRVLLGFTVFQAILMFVTPSMSLFIVLILISTCIGMCYGSNLALFPSMTKDYFGLKNFGVNYGLVFTAWGVGSIMSLVAGKIYDVSLKAAKAALPAGDTTAVFGHYDKALYLAGAFLVITMVLSFIVKKPGEAAPAK